MKRNDLTNIPPAVRIGNEWHYEDGTVLRVVSGGDGPNDGTPPEGGEGQGAGEGASSTEGQPAGEGAGNEGTAAGEGEGQGDGAGAEGEGEGAQASAVDVPALDTIPGFSAEATADDGTPLPLREITEDDLRGAHEWYAAVWDANREGDPLAVVGVLEQVHERQSAIRAELERRGTERASALERIGGMEPVELPAPVEQPLASAARSASLRAAGGRTEAVRQPAGLQAPALPANRPRVAMVAAAGPGALSETEVDLGALGQRFDRARRGEVGKVYLAGIGAFTDMAEGDVPEALSMDLGAPANDRLISEAVEDWRARQRGETAPARQAAICEPFDIIREIPDNFVADEPVSGIFPSRPAGRLGFTFTPSMQLTGVAGGHGIWTSSDQDAVDPADPTTWKDCVEVECGTPDTIEAIWAFGCLLFRNDTEISSPERMRNAQNALSSARARDKEGRVLSLIDAETHHYHVDFTYGAVPELIGAINTALAQGQEADRIGLGEYVAILPPGVTQVLLNDQVAKGFNSDAVRDLLAYILDNLEGVSRIVQSLDWSDAGEVGQPFPALNAVGPGAVTELPRLGDTYAIRLIDPSGWIYAETGEMFTGVARSPDLLRQNKAQFFSEQAFMLAKHGPQPDFTLRVELCDSGSRADLVTPRVCPAAS